MNEKSLLCGSIEELRALADSGDLPTTISWDLHMICTCAERQMNWRLIKSAPKDGTPILGCDSKGGMQYVCWWVENCNGWVFFAPHGNDSKEKYYFFPTHWKYIELPPPKLLEAA